MECSTPIERLGRNELLFREVNERIREVAGKFGVLDVTLFICECGHPECAETLELKLQEYDALRSSPGSFVMIPGHAAAHEQILRRHLGYNVVGVGEKQPARPLERNA